jgi:hypothetical protein
MFKKIFSSRDRAPFLLVMLHISESGLMCHIIWHGEVVDELKHLLSFLWCITVIIKIKQIGIADASEGVLCNTAERFMAMDSICFRSSLKLAVLKFHQQLDSLFLKLTLKIVVFAVCCFQEYQK